MLKMKNLNKYRNVKTEVDRRRFDSKKEAEYYIELRQRKKNGEVRYFLCQPEFPLQAGFKTREGKKIREIKYIADFIVVYEDGREEIIDVKGMKTEVFRIKEKLFRKKYPDLILKIV